MQIVLIANVEQGQAGFPPERIEGIDAPRRFYDIVDGILTIAGYPDVILHHDAEELLQQSIYRMPTPAEQEQMAQAQEQASIVQENEPPAQKSKKQNGGG